MAKQDKTRQVELTIEQQNAVELLITGKSDREVAELCGVSRQTVNDWRHKNALFVAELNRQRAGLWDCDIDRLRGLVRAAITVLEDDLQGDDIKARRVAAVHLLRAVGIYGASHKPEGETSTRRIELDWALDNL
jgi:hypothetical protein